jgi:diaminohydroxyphosphoribosylaminopyrimidine deaminase / 5-amino-6-(5-phosphoribosylamino)uracil reductase
LKSGKGTKRPTGPDEGADERFMARALELAGQGRGTTRPNPVVGAVVVRGGRVVGEGYHVRAGAPHAEVNALAAVKAAGARGATLYVNLEPCCHTGRTGPCTEAILAAGITRVVVGCPDPNPLVDGRGVERLRGAGVTVDVGCLEAESQEANRSFATWVREGRPLVTLKAAATLDGFIADGRPRAEREPVWLTGPEARQEAHAMRAMHDAVLVGSGTVLADDPQLTVRLPGETAAPLRVVLDGRLRTPPGSKVLAGARTLVFTKRGAPAAKVRALEAAGAEVVALAAKVGPLPVTAVLKALAARDIQSVLVEGGSAVHGAFIAAGLVDDVALFFAPKLLGGGLPIATGKGRGLPAGLELDGGVIKVLGGDLLVTGRARPQR